MMKNLVFVSGAAVAGAQFFAPRSGEFGGSPFFGVAPAPPAPEAAGDLDDLEALLSLAAEASSVSPTGLVIVRRTTFTIDAPAFVVSRYDDDDRAPGDDSPHDFECPCGADVDRLCGNEQADDFYLSIFQKRLCLSGNRDFLSPACAAHLEEAPTVVEYCYDDVVDGCAGVQPGENRVHACLAGRATLGEACAAYVDSVAPPPPPAVDDAARAFERLVASSLDMLSAVFESPLFGDDDVPPPPPPAGGASPLPKAPRAAPKAAAPRPAAYENAAAAERAAAAAEAEDEAWAAELAEEEEERSVAAVVLLAAAVVGLLAALWVLAYVAHYSLRRRQERAAVAEFKSKFAPLLPRENAI